ncbi:metal-dependent hydrolase [Aquimarina agarivorans]|uniref:metal-dependent hydrolase n=1 Tax=Aquimarina agarivorans TaxID=980584 RepID=UPI000248EB42|nr:metal-dependent hydrolase [Aquimarina agarivorans]
MDSLTQIVLGAAVGEATISKKVGNKAILWGAIAGTIPDLDIIIKYFTDTVTANELHRGFSHSILFCIIAAPIFGWLVHKISGNAEANWKDWTRLMFWGLFTHPILDAFTTWGTQLFWPHPYKIAFKNIFVIDPLYTIPFLICVIIAMTYERTNPKRKKINHLGLILSTSYLVLTLLFKWYTFNVFEQNLKNQQRSYNSIQTKPTPLNSILWNANVETQNAYLIGDYSLFDGNTPVQFAKYPKNHELLGKLKDHPLILRLIDLTEGWYTIEKVGNTFYFNDLRFGLYGTGKANDRFVFSYKLYYDDQGKLQAKERDPDIEKAPELLKKLVKRIFGKKEL